VLFSKIITVTTVCVLFTLTVTVQSLVYWDVVDNICQEWQDGFCCRL